MFFLKSKPHYSSLALFSLCLLLSFNLKAGPNIFEKSCVSSANLQNESIGKYKGRYSEPEQIRNLEQEFSKSTDIKTMKLELKEGDLDTAVLRASYQQSKNGHLWERLSQTELLELDYALLLTEKKLSEFHKKGIHPSQIKKESYFEGFISMRSYLSQIPDEKLKFSPRVLAKAYKALQSKNAKSFWQRFQQRLGFTIKEESASSLPEIKDTQSIVLNKRLSKKASQNIEASLLALREVGLFKENSLDNLQKLRVEKLDFQFSKPQNWFHKAGFTKITFPNSKLRILALKSFQDWLSREMNKIDKDSVDAVDPIELAAISEYAIHFLRPFPEKNYVIAKAIKNRILQKYSLAVDLRYDEANLDFLDLDLQSFVNRVRKGVFYAIHIIENNFSYETGANALDTSIGLHPDLDILDQLPENLKEQLSHTIHNYKSAHSHAIEVGSNIRKKLMFRGQFFLSTDDIVYTYVKSQNRFYPLSEMDLVLYSQGGSYVKRTTHSFDFNQETSDAEVLIKSPNRVFSQAITDNIDLFSKIINQEIDPKEIEVESLDLLLKNNAENNGLGRHHFYDFQKDLIEAALENPLSPKEYPLTYLATSRSYNDSWMELGPSALQANITLNRPDHISIGKITAAYTFRRNFLLKLRRDLELYQPQLFKEKKDLIDQERKNIYIAARSLLQPYIHFMKEAFGKRPGKSNHPDLQDKDFHTYVRNHAYWKSLYIYFKDSEWAYPSFEMALEKVDQSTLLVSRNIAAVNFNFQGLTTESQQADRFIYKILGKQIIQIQKEIDKASKENRDLDAKKVDGLIKSLIIAYLSDNDSKGKRKSEARILLNNRIKNGIRKIAKKVLKPRYSTRGLLASNQRFFLDNYLHSKGLSPQELKSTSVNQYFLAKVHLVGTMQFIPEGTNYIYRVKIGEEAVNSEYSMYPTEAEVLENVKLSPFSAWWRLAFKASEKDLIQDQENPMTQKTEEVLRNLVKFEKDHEIIPPQSEVLPIKKLNDVFPETDPSINFEDFDLQDPF